jgi:hypothetical protein
MMSPESSMKNRKEESLTDIEEQVMEKDENNNQDDDDDEESATTTHVSLGCGVLGRYPIISLITFVLTGILLGIGISYWRPTDEDGQNSKAVALQWIGLVGDMFLRYVSYFCKKKLERKTPYEFIKLFLTFTTFLLPPFSEC